MTIAELRQNTLKFVKGMLPDAGEIDIKTATDKIVKNLAYLTEDSDSLNFRGRGDLRLPRPRRG